MKKVWLLIFKFFKNICSYTQGDSSLLQIHSLTGSVFGNTGSIRVLPSSAYNRERKKYPVLYMNDGFAVFKNLGLQKTVYSSLEPIIIVCIDNAINSLNQNSDLRTNEYLPCPDELEATVPNRQGKLYTDIIKEEVIPIIESKYRVKKGKRNRFRNNYYKLRNKNYDKQRISKKSLRLSDG